jgi:hypothetical protein
MVHCSLFDRKQANLTFTVWTCLDVSMPASSTADYSRDDDHVAIHTVRRMVACRYRLKIDKEEVSLELMSQRGLN